MDQLKENNHEDYSPTVDYLAYSRLRDVNVIPEQDYKALVAEVFQTITDQLRATYGPYGRQVMMNQGIENTTTKDGYNTFTALNFKNPYKKMVYMNIKDICERVNRVVGDGTTSCILLAEKMFNEVNAIIQTPDDKRNALKAFNKIEADYQDMAKIRRDREAGVIKDLDKDSMRNLINLADNYDEELTEILMHSMNPTTDENGRVTSVRNIVINSNIDPESDSNVHCTFEYLPGQYRIAVEMNPDVAESFSEWSHVKMIIYNHTFGENDWDKFYREYDKEKREEVLIIAPAFTQKFLDACYAFAYCTHECGKENLPVKIKLARIRGLRPQNEIKDLCAILDTKAIPPEAPIIEHNAQLVEADIRVIHGNCMCFDNVKAPTTYIEDLKKEMETAIESSKGTINEYNSRIEALSLSSAGDTDLSINGSTALEVVMIADKVRDCVSIVRSAISYGIVSNMLKYGYNRTGDVYKPELSIFERCTDPKLQKVGREIENAIRRSIKGLYIDIWRSKYYATKDDEGFAKCDEFYEGLKPMSFDIIEEEYVLPEAFPTSAQYDLEVLVAAISIVKYQITSPVFIFDANLVPQQASML